jgi:integrase
VALTDLAVKKAKAMDKPYKLADSQGLFVLVNPSGSKLWRWKYRVSGREKLMALGAYPEVSLEKAREQRNSARKQLNGDVDPMVSRKETRRAKALALEQSFQSIARAWWQKWKGARSERHAEYVLKRLEADVFPDIGARPISELQSPDLVMMVKKIEARGALDIAKRSLQTCGQIFRYAIAHGLCSRNPVADIRPSDILGSRKVVNFARIDVKELPELLRRIEGYQGAPATRLALKIMANTFVRTSELIHARWEEFDFEGARWTIPAERMKMRTPHIVPLSAQVLETLRVLQLVTSTSAFLFPGERDHEKPMSNNTLLGALKRMGYQGRMTGHGFRGVASTALHEQGFRHEHIEIQLAHQERDEVSAAYNYAQYLKERAKMMQHWSDYLDSCVGGKVISGKFRKAS